MVRGPVAAMLATARRLGWSVRGAFVLVTDLGRELDLRADPPVVVGRGAIRAFKDGDGIESPSSIPIWLGANAG